MTIALKTIQIPTCYEVKSSHYSFRDDNEKSTVEQEDCSIGVLDLNSSSVLVVSFIHHLICFLFIKLKKIQLALLFSQDCCEDDISSCHSYI